MHILPPYTYASGRLAEERRQESMRDGEHAYLLRVARLARPKPTGGVLFRLGCLLARAAEGLRVHLALPGVDLQSCPAPQGF